MNNYQASDKTRRPIKSRGKSWAIRTAKNLAKTGITPNQISLTSIFFSIAAGCCLILSPYPAAGIIKTLLFILAACFIQLRLICNLLDGMVAVEHDKKTRSGQIFNDLPDRIADPIILVSAGYAAGLLSFAIEAGWLAALLAVITAYIRLLGNSAGAAPQFIGPMAKQHRMAVMTLTNLICAVVLYWNWHLHVIFLSLIIISIGCLITIIRRLLRITAELEKD